MNVNDIVDMVLSVSEPLDPMSFLASAKVIQLGWPSGSRIEKLKASARGDMVVNVIYPDGSRHVHIATKEAFSELTK